MRYTDKERRAKGGGDNIKVKETVAGEEGS